MMKKALLPQIAIFALATQTWAQTSPLRAPAILPEETKELVKISGEVTGFTDIHKDGIMDGALVVPTLKAKDILSFSFDSLLAPDEEMKVGFFKELVPGNFYFPKQSENYGIFPVGFKKESFKLQLTRGQSDELVAVWFQTPFKKMADLARHNAPYAQLLPLLHLKAFGFGSERDWTNEAQPSVNLDGTFTQTAPYSWTRTAGAADQIDIIVAFQRTPANKWMMTDLVPNAPVTGTLATASGMQPDLKVLMARVTNSKDDEPVAALGHFMAGDTASTYAANELPEQIQNAQMASDGTLSWDPIRTPGWMAILRTTYTTQNSREEALKKGFGVMDMGLSALPGGTATLEAWIDPSTGSYELLSPLAQGEHLSLLFIGTDRPVARPEAKDDEPELFTFAKELKMLMVK